MHKNKVSEIVSYEELLSVLGSSSGIAFCHGCFDKLHDGHRKLLKKARNLGEVVVVGLEEDSYIKRNKGDHRPFFSLKQRVEDIKKTGLVDYIFSISDSGPEIYANIYSEISPDFVVTGDDEGVSYKKRDTDWIDAEIVIVKRTPHSSSKDN